MRHMIGGELGQRRVQLAPDRASYARDTPRRPARPRRSCRGSPREIPSTSQIWRTKAATDVLPLVPVTATTRSGWRAGEARRHARRAPARIGSAIVTGPRRRHRSTSRPASTATAPAATACGMKRAPSTLVPGKRREQKARPAPARLSAVRPVMALAASSGGSGDDHRRSVWPASRSCGAVSPRLLASACWPAFRASCDPRRSGSARCRAAARCAR